MSRPSQGITQHQQLQQRLNLRQMLLGKLLEMSTPEFEEEIVRAMEENPALTTVDNVDGQHEAEPSDGDADFDNDDYDGADVQRRPHGEILFRQTPVATTDAETIEQQLDEMSLTDIERETARYIIGNLDSSGYLTRSADEIADDMALNDGIDVARSVVEKMIKVVKTLDPAGIGAESLRECLQIQLDRLPDSPVVKIARDILRRHYKLFVGNRMEAIREAIGCSDADFEAAIKLIRSLNPKPGAGLFDSIGDERTRHITPDFIIDVDDRGRPYAMLAGQVPELAISRTFSDEPEHADRRASEFIRERREGAEEFIDAVRRRGSTLMAIIHAIMRLQPEFFDTFELHDLRPMVLRDIEELTGLDKSVISRATSTKYMLTPDGIFSLKSLFGESASSISEIAPREVEEYIRRLIDAEDKQHPMNDDELTEALNARGMAVARRTVAKYRERIGIPVARLRRRSLNNLT